MRKGILNQSIKYQLDLLREGLDKILTREYNGSIMRVKNRLKGIVLKLVWEQLKAEYTMSDLAKALGIPLPTFFRYVKNMHKFNDGLNDERDQIDKETQIAEREENEREDDEEDERFNALGEAKEGKWGTLVDSSQVIESALKANLYQFKGYDAMTGDDVGAALDSLRSMKEMFEHLTSEIKDELTEKEILPI